MSLFPYTFQNHFQFGYRDPLTLETRWLDRRRSDDEVFVATYGRATQKVSSWRDANVLASQRIIERARDQGLKPVICYSGGLDSEVTLVSMIEALLKLSPDLRTPIEVATLVDEHGLNQHDVEYVEKFRRQHEDEWLRLGLSISFETDQIDIEAFLKSDTLQTVFEETQMLSPILNSHVLLFQKIFERSQKSLPIIGQGELYLSRESGSTDYSPASWSLVETENLCGLYRYFVGRGRPAIPGFFQYLPEQFETQLRTNPVLHELISNSRFGKLGTRTSKAEIIAFDYPELEVRPKFTGFEKIEALHDEIRERFGRKHPRLESKWSMDVFELMQQLRPVRPEPAQSGDWRYGWGQSTDLFASRTNGDDFFATEWSRDPRELYSKTAPGELQGSTSQPCAHSSMPSSARSSPGLVQEFISTLRSLAPSDTFVLHDGSLTARVFSAALSARLVQTPNVDRLVENLNGREIVRWMFLHGALDSESLALLCLAEDWSKTQTSKGTSLLVPRFHSRIVNAEYDRHLEATLAKPRFIWTESERLAVLTNALGSIGTKTKVAEAVARENASNESRFILPWTSAKLASLLLEAVKTSGWMSFDEPGPAATDAVDEFLKSVLHELGESDALAAHARTQETLLLKLRTKIDSLLTHGHQSPPRFFASARSLSHDPTHDASKSFSFRLSDLAFHGKSLKAVDDSIWLAHARTAEPEIALPSNLFFHQSIEGFRRLDPSLRSSFARTFRGDEVAWAHLCVLSLPPWGRFRIRGVTVRADRRREGHATELIRSIAEASQTLSGFSGIDVFAAPNVVNAFINAGFVEDVRRVSRKEEVVDPATGQLATTERDLMPMSFDFFRDSGRELAAGRSTDSGHT